MRVRGERALGDLDSVRVRVTASKAAAQRRLKLIKIAEEFYSEENSAARWKMGKLTTVDEWTLSEFGEQLEATELNFVRESSARISPLYDS